MQSIIYNPIFWIFISYAIGAILTDFLLKKQKVDWFDNKNFISDSLTKQLGVLVLGWLVKNTFMGWFNKNLNLKPSASKEDLKKLKQEMGFAEAGHTIAFYFLLLVNGWMLYYGVGWGYALLFLMLNIIFNLYLVFLQQYNKRRIDRVLGNR